MSLGALLLAAGDAKILIHQLSIEIQAREAIALKRRDWRDTA